MKRTIKTNHLYCGWYGTIALLWIVAGCQSSSGHQLQVIGQIKNAGGQKIMLAELPYGSINRMVIDSTTADSAGRFELQSQQGEERMHQLFVEDGPGFLLINDNNEIEITADMAAPENYQVKGSPATESIRVLYTQFMPAYLQAQEAANKAQAIAQNKEASDSTRNVVFNKRNHQQKELESVFARFFATQSNATAYFFALGMSKNFLPPSTWQQYLTTARKKWPQHGGIQMLK